MNVFTFHFYFVCKQTGQLRVTRMHESDKTEQLVIGLFTLYNFVSIKQRCNW